MDLVTLKLESTKDHFYQNLTLTNDLHFKRENVHSTTGGLHIINHITHLKGETTPTQTKDILDQTFIKILDQVFNNKVIFKIIIGLCSQGMVLKHLVSYSKTQGWST